MEFENGEVATHDLIVGTDGIGSSTRRIIVISTDKQPAETSCLHANVLTEDAVAAGLVDFSQDSALQYWGGQGTGCNRIVLSPCQGGGIIILLLFFSQRAG